MAAWARAMLCIACLLLPFGAVAQTPAPEREVKAAFLYRFAAFVAWPDSSFENADSPLQLCIVGDPLLRAEVERSARGQRIIQRPLLVRELSSLATHSGCHIAYIADTLAHPAREALTRVATEPVLTVTDQASSRGVQGIIHFQIMDRRVRFRIDDAAAARNRLVISSRLLDLAVSVRRRQ